MTGFLHILYIVQYFNLPDEAGGGRAYHFARRWVGRGHRVTVLTGTVNHKTSTVADRYRGRLFTRETIEGIDIIRCASTALTRRSYVGRLANFSAFALLATLAALLRARHPDIVYASSTPLTVGFPGYLAARRWRCPFIFEVRDLWPESAVVAGVLRSRAMIAVARWFEEFLYRRADRMVAVTRGIQEGIVGHGIDPSSVVLIPNGVDDVLADTAADGMDRPALDADGRFRCLYVGAIGLWNGNETIVEAARLLQDQAGLEFLFVGDGDQRPDLERRAREWGLSSVRFAGVLPKREAVREMGRADICLICTWDHPFHRMVLANKIFDYLAAGRPVVAAAHGEMAELLERSGAGVSVPPGDAVALARAIRSLRSLSGEERQTMGRRGRDYVLAHYRRRDLADRAERIMTALATGGDA